MISLTPDEINQVLLQIETQKLSSNLGFFSKPFRRNLNGVDYIIKLYIPLRDKKFNNYLLQQHHDYILALLATGIKVPDTLIFTREVKNREQLVIIQHAFQENELLRTLMQESNESEVYENLTLIFNDTLLYWKNKKPGVDIGFHPTLRNYSKHQGSLYYFDTFPPMLMSQKKLNRLIIRMSPFGGFIKKLVPQKAINRVSNEYYHLDKMFTGIVGSTCRLRPEWADQILAFSIQFIQQSQQITETEKQNILNLLSQPPKLSGLWVFIRKISGNTGQPNIKK